jgi:protein O-GlcNAc transferase
MRTPYRACPLCDGKEMQTILTADCSNHALYNPLIPPTMTWQKCAACGHVFTDGYYTKAAFDIVFAKTHDNQKVGFDLENQRFISARMIEKVLPYARLGYWLDVGFGNGSLLFTAEEFGFIPVGIDLQEDNVQGLRNTGIEAHCVDLGGLRQPARFSVVSLADVLEHMPYPRDSLRMIHGLLNSGGILFLSMPNMDSALWKALDDSHANPYWGELEHFHNFGRKRLVRLLNENGFEVVRSGISERYRASMEIVAKKVGATIGIPVGVSGAMVDRHGNSRPSGAFDMSFSAMSMKSNPIQTPSRQNVDHVTQQLNRSKEAQISPDRTSERASADAEALNNRGNALLELQRPEEALASYDQALALKPDYAHAYSNRGLALLNLKRYDEALASLNLAIEFKPDFALAFNNRGYVLQQMNRQEEALACYERALALQPDDVGALNNHANALLELQRNEEALASYDSALRLEPDSAEVLNNRGLALLNLKRYEEALAGFDRALELKPDFALAHNNRGNALRDMGRYEEAARSFAQVVQVAPDYDYGLGNLFHTQILCCDWSQHTQNADSIAKSVTDGKRVIVPFPFLIFSKSAPAQLQCARIFVADKCPASRLPLWKGQRYRHDKIRVAYLSADFYNHATAYLMAELFEAHDKQRFETTAISFGPDVRDAMRERLQPSFDQFVDVGKMSDLEVAQLVLQLEIDIAIDLKGFTTGCRTGIFAHRPSPVQVNYLGYPGTMSADYIDYIIADQYLIPAEHQVHYSEKIVYLPDTYQVNDRKRSIGARTPSRAELKLPESGFVFCCFNNNFKISPEIFDVWMRLLNQVSGSVLWLLEDNTAASRNLRREAEKRGVAPERLVFSARMNLDEHLARQRQADLFLDTLPYNAHTTASDALWAGLPVLTCMGETFAGRVAASLLNAVGLPELICHTLEDYEALALRLATAPAMLVDIRAKLARNRITCPLFDASRFCRHIESAYVTMWERCQRGEPPASFAVQAQAK